MSKTSDSLVPEYRKWFCEKHGRAPTADEVQMFKRVEAQCGHWSDSERKAMLNANRYILEQMKKQGVRNTSELSRDVWEKAFAFFEYKDFESNQH